jgi:hypothetical protein
MYARWLIGLEAMALGIPIYCAAISGNLRFEGRIVGLDEAYDTESHMRHFIWRLRAREALLFVVALWVAAILLAAYRRIRSGDFESGIAKYGSRACVVATLNSSNRWTYGRVYIGPGFWHLSSINSWIRPHERTGIHSTLRARRGGGAV